jgi:hypothetical protein
MTRLAHSVPEASSSARAGRTAFPEAISIANPSTDICRINNSKYLGVFPQRRLSYLRSVRAYASAAARLVLASTKEADHD